MIYEIEVSRQADADLREIYEYITFELLAPDNAARQLDKLEERIDSLKEFPEKHRVYEKEPWHSRGMRVMPVNNFLVFYIPNRETAMITIIRVMYAGRDVDSQLKTHTKTTS